LNLSILSLRIMKSTANSPFITRGARSAGGSFTLQSSNLQNFFSKFIFSSGTEFIKIRNTNFALFLDSPVAVNKIIIREPEEIAKECEAFPNNTNPAIVIIEGVCKHVTDSYWLDKSDTAIRTTGALMCERVNFTKCNGQNGGGIQMNSTNDCELTDCIFDQCTATSDGGAFYLYGKNIKLHMVNIMTCTSSSKNSVKVHSRSFIARHFYVDKYSHSIIYTENPTYYPNYYAVFSLSVFNTNLVLNVTNITLTNVEINCKEEENVYAILSTATNASLSNVAFSGSPNCVYFASKLLYYAHDNIYATSHNGCKFYPDIGRVEVMENRPVYPQATQVKTNAINDVDNQGSSTTADSGGISPGWIVLIVFACLIAACAIVGSIYYCISHTECTRRTDEMVTTYNFG
jgi:hypothetical protein